MNFQKTICLLAFSLSINFLIAQTIGVTKSTDGALEGYTFFSPFSGTKAYLVDNCGRLVNQWDRGTRPGLAAYFLDNGLMMRTFKANPQGPFDSASNSGGLELVDWNNNTVWSYEFNTPTLLSHHDAVMMPNGNILVLIWELIYRDELIDLGRDPNRISNEDFVWNERIWEIEPVGTDDIKVLWEWRINDHYVQDFDSTKMNFGVISEHPELFDINLADINSSNSHADVDYNHFNAIDYNEDLDQILISVRNSDEIWIIDHSTTTDEASGHSGGEYGKGGDILYRWGNANAYQRGAVSDQKLFGQHGVNWIKDGLKDAGKIMIFNNGNGRPGTDYSTGEILVPPIGADGNYVMPTTESFGPDVSEKVYGDLSSERFYSPYLSNFQRLSNGNSLMNFGSPGTMIEVDSNRNEVWKYVIPLNGDVPYEQGRTARNNGNFRAYKFDKNYPGFTGVDLIPGDLLEIGDNPLGCDLSGIEDDFVKANFELIYDSNLRTIKISDPDNSVFQTSIFDITGRAVFSTKEAVFQIPNLTSGIYFVKVRNQKGGFGLKKIFVFGN